MVSNLNVLYPIPPLRVLATTTGLNRSESLSSQHDRPRLFRSAVDGLRHTHGLTKIIVVGDRGMFSAANVSHLAQLNPSYLYVSVLRSTQIRTLIDNGGNQLGLFDETDLFEITHSDYRGERLMVAKNEALGTKRGLERIALLEVAIKTLDVRVGE